MQLRWKKFSKITILIFILDFLLFGSLGYLMPLVGDDLNWWSSWGVHYFFNGTFLHYDGRYLGDLLIILLSHSPYFSFVMYGACAVVLVYLLSKIVLTIFPKISWQLVLLVNSCFLLFLPRSIFQQIWGWHAGFANYLPSLIFPLFYLLLTLQAQNSSKVWSHRYWWLLLIIATLSQLLAEHITLLNCFAVIMVFFFRKHYVPTFVKNCWRPIAIGNFLGAILMFMNEAYWKILLGKDSYRSLNQQQNETLISYLKNMSVLHQQRFLLSCLLIFFLLAFVIWNNWHFNNPTLQITTFVLLSMAIISQLPFIIVAPYGPRCALIFVLLFELVLGLNLAPWITKVQLFLSPLLLVILTFGGLLLVNVARDYHQTFTLARDLSVYQWHQHQPKTYVLNYHNTDLLWTNNNSIDHNFTTLFVNPKSKVVPVDYQTWRKFSKDLKLEQPTDRKILLHRLQEKVH
ncbi:hypothetical protein [Bombilactobacillus thymidiniphilus]|uniref:Glucosyltransferase GtrII-like protein n=1 Tax=Bombilactobacillus thymidiniphilus TaxID=2923363 RepID=A0ABY4PD09_9LACO|nr:hypothetical protein [Bombilactobacillus thymidiniphilus]UQS83439.1 hypothetical protein MOO47_06605 [Bombilactobacillus thymidiniphilus]